MLLVKDILRKSNFVGDVVMPLPLDLKENRLEVSTTSRGRKRVSFQATITDRGRLELSSRFNGFKNKYSKKSSPNKFLEFYYDNKQSRLHIGFTDRREDGFTKPLGKSKAKLGLTITSLLQQIGLELPEKNEKFVFTTGNKGLEINEEEKYFVLDWKCKITQSVKVRSRIEKVLEDFTNATEDVLDSI